MTDNVTPFPVAESRAAKDVSVLEILRDVIREIEAGEIAPDSVLILALRVGGDERDGEIKGNWRRAGPAFHKHSETLGWLRYFEDAFLRDMRVE